jgi:hypothetical protein
MGFKWTYCNSRSVYADSVSAQTSPHLARICGLEARTWLEQQCSSSTTSPCRCSHQYRLARAGLRTPPFCKQSMRYLS